MPQPRGTLPKEKKGKGKRKTEKASVEKQYPEKKRKGEVIETTIFKFKEKVNKAAPGTEPRPSDQKNEPLCTFHAMAKCIQQALHDHKIDADHDEIVKSLCGLFGGDHETARYPQELNGKRITVIEKSETGQVSEKRFAVTLGVSTWDTWNAAWPPIVPEVHKDIRTSSAEILAIGLLQIRSGDPHSNHAVFIKSYDKEKNVVRTINSHGEGGELGPKKEEDFYAVCFVGMSFHQVMTGF